MIGLFAIASRRAVSREAEILREQMHSRSCWAAETWSSAGFAAGRVGPPRQGSSWTSPDGSLRAWLDGFADLCENGRIRAAGAGDIAEALVSRGPKALLDFSGEFFAIVHDACAKRLYAATDRYGTRSAYWRQADGTVGVCSQLGALLRAGAAAPALNRRYVACLLRFNKCRLGDETLFDGVRIVMPGVVQSWDLDRPGSPPVESVYYEHVFTADRRSEEEWAEEIVSLFRRAASKASRRARTLALSLSGGLDSRAILASFDERQRGSLVAFSCGLPDSADVLLAARVAACAGVPYRNIDLGPSEFLAGACLSIARNEEFDIFVQGAQIELQRRAAEEAEALITGWDLDVPLRGAYLTPAVLALQDRAGVKKAIEENWALFSGAELRQAARPGFAAEAEAPDAMLDQILGRFDGPDPVRSYLRFLFVYEKFRLLMLRNRMARFEMETLTPFYDVELQSTLARIPESLKLNNRLFARVLNRLSPELAEIPYQRTMLPASVPVEFWARGAEIEARRETLLRDIYAATGIRVPYRRFYSNFDEWLVSDPEWRSFANRLLCSPDTILTREILTPAAVRGLMEGHSSSSNRTKLICLMSLELYLREYFGEADIQPALACAGAAHV